MADVEFVVYREGELDIATIPAVRDEWLAVIDDVQPDLLVIDLSAVTFLDSSALTAILEVRKRQRMPDRAWVRIEPLCRPSRDAGAGSVGITGRSRRDAAARAPDLDRCPVHTVAVAPTPRERPGARIDRRD